MKIIFVKWLACLFLLMAPSIVCHAGKYQDKQEKVFFTSNLTEKQLLPVKQGFIDAFMDIYKNVSEEILKVENKDDFLEKAFQEETDDFNKSGVSQIILTRENGEILGYFSFNNIDEYRKTSPQAAKEFKDFPKNSAYIRQLYVVPTVQKQGLGTLMIEKIVQEFFPEMAHLYVATRRINDAARKLYEGCGFKESVEVLHGLPKERYMSFEKHLSS